jgi:hypothetical protein
LASWRSIGGLEAVEVRRYIVGMKARRQSEQEIWATVLELVKAGEIKLAVSRVDALAAAYAKGGFSDIAEGLRDIGVQLANGELTEAGLSKLVAYDKELWARHRPAYLDLGRAILNRQFGRLGQEFSEEALKTVLKSFNCATVEELFVAVGNGQAKFSPNDVALAVFPGLQTNIASLTRQSARIGESNQPDYTVDAPPSRSDDASQKGMQDDFNTALAMSRYEVLAQHVDLLNPRLPESVKLTRAERLVKAYKRLRKAKPDFEDKGEQMQAANRIRTAGYRRRKREEQLRKAASM